MLAIQYYILIIPKVDINNVLIGTECNDIGIVTQQLYDKKIWYKRFSN